MEESALTIDYAIKKTKKSETKSGKHTKKAEKEEVKQEETKKNPPQ